MQTSYLYIAALLVSVAAPRLAAEPTFSERSELERAEVGAAKELVVAALSHIRLLQGQYELLSKAVEELEVEIIDALPDDSPLIVAIDEAEAAERTYVAAQARVLASPSYKLAYQTALASSNKEQELPRVRREFIERDQATQDALLHRSAARKRLDVARQEVLGQDENWSSIMTELRETKAGITHAKQAIERGQLASAAASSAWRDASALAARANALADAARRAAEAQRAAAKKKGNQNNRRKRGRR